MLKLGMFFVGALRSGEEGIFQHTSTVRNYVKTKLRKKSLRGHSEISADLPRVLSELLCDARWFSAVYERILGRRCVDWSHRSSAH